MAENSGIEWTDHTHNHWTGCSKVSPGCDGCYAEAWAKRSGTVKWGPGAARRLTTDANRRKPLVWEAQHAAFFAAHGRRQRVFCSSLADVFDNEVDPAWRVDLFALIARTPHLDWLLLTKRIGNVRAMARAAMIGSLQATADQDPHLPPNVWLGATVVNQAEADRDVPKLLDTPARVRFLSIEPILGRIDLGWLPGDDGERLDVLAGWRNIPAGGGCYESRAGRRIDWVIAGGESGHQARPAHPDWFRSLRDQCDSAGVPFLFKQWGEWASTSEVEGEGRHHQFEDGATVRRVGKAKAGRTLDGITHDGFPG